MTMIYALAIAATLTACGAGQGWSRANTAMEAAFLGELTIDATETAAWILPSCTETNPVVGRCGERMPLGAYVGGVALVHVAVAWLLPARARDAWQAITLGVEGHVVVLNVLTHRVREERGR